MTVIKVCDGDDVIALSFEDLLKYHGRSSIGGVAHGFKAMERGLPLLCAGQPPDRYGIDVQTAFDGPGARDAFEMVTRAVTGGRYRVAPEIPPADVPHAPQGQYFFRLRYRGTTVDLALRDGHIRDEFTQLVRKGAETHAEQRRLAWLKKDMADRLLALPAERVYDVR